MKNRYSLALLTIIACLTSAQTISAASQARGVANVFKRAHSTVPMEALEAFRLASNKSKNIFDREIAKAKEAHQQRMTDAHSKLPNGIVQNAPNLKAGISKLIAALAAGYWLGMNHETIEKKFNEEIRPALTLDNLPTKDETAAFVGQSTAQAKALVEQSTEYLKKEFKKAALKNPDQEPKTESNQENQNS